MLGHILKFYSSNLLKFIINNLHNLYHNIMETIIKTLTSKKKMNVRYVGCNIYVKTKIDFKLL